MCSFQYAMLPHSSIGGLYTDLFFLPGLYFSFWARVQHRAEEQGLWHCTPYMSSLLCHYQLHVLPYLSILSFLICRRGTIYQRSLWMIKWISTCKALRVVPGTLNKQSLPALRTSSDPWEAAPRTGLSLWSHRVSPPSSQEERAAPSSALLGRNIFF